MSGPIEDLPIRHCPRCRATYMEDDQMYEDVDRCPKCGKRLRPAPEYEGKTDPLDLEV